MMKKLLLLFALLALAPLSAPAQLWSGLIAPSRAIDWQNHQVGVIGGIPSASWPQCVTSACNTVYAAGTSATAAQINAALASAPADSVVQLTSGSYSLSAGITMKPNVVLRGMGTYTGASLTSLNFTGAVTCGGQGAQICFMDGTGAYYGSSYVLPGQSNAATITGGAVGGSNSLTVTNAGSSGLHNGDYVDVDQADDNPSAASSVTSGMLVCDNTKNVNAGTVSDGCSLEGGSPGRKISGVDYNMTQIVQIVSGCATACTGAGPFTITITPALDGPKWSNSANPGLWWSSSTMQNAGLENLSINSLSVANGTGDCGGNNISCSAIDMFNAYNCWVSGVRSIDANRNHVWLWNAAHDTIQNSYFFGTLNAASQSYGVESFIGSDNLVVNNIFHQVTGPIMMGPSMGSVFAYNFALDDYYYVSGWLQQAFSWGHDAGAMYNLSEGNITSGYWSDVFHGTGGANTVFRNYAVGWEVGKNQATVPVQLESFQRFQNIIGNVLGCNSTNAATYPGNCGSPNQNTYQTTTGKGAAGSIYDIGGGNSEPSNGGNPCTGAAGSANPIGTCVQPDPYTLTSLYRFGNYDVKNGSAQFNNAEVPTALADGYVQSIPASHTLPVSLWTTTPNQWNGVVSGPGIGPDVTTGSVPGVSNTVVLNTAANCALNVMAMPVDGTGSVLPFNEPACYSTSTPSTASPTFSPVSPYSGGNATVAIADSTSGATITYCASGSGTCTPGTTYSAGISFTSSGPANICAFANATGYSQSATVCWSGTYGAPVCADPVQLSPNYSGSYLCTALTSGSSCTSVYGGSTLPLSIGFSEPTSGCGLLMTLDGTTPTYPASGTTVTYAAQSITSSKTMRVIAGQTGDTNSNVVGGSWSLSSAGAVIAGTVFWWAFF